MKSSQVWLAHASDLKGTAVVWLTHPNFDLSNGFMQPYAMRTVRLLAVAGSHVWQAPRCLDIGFTDDLRGILQGTKRGFLSDNCPRVGHFYAKCSKKSHWKS
jgi:hypothetical protein